MALEVMAMDGAVPMVAREEQDAEEATSGAIEHVALAHGKDLRPYELSSPRPGFGSMWPWSCQAG